MMNINFIKNFFLIVAVFSILFLFGCEKNVVSLKNIGSGTIKVKSITGENDKNKTVNKSIIIVGSGNIDISSKEISHNNIIKNSKVDRLKYSTRTHFYYLNCNKIFTSINDIKQCQLWGLKEAAAFCWDKKYFPNMSIQQIFSPKKFNLISAEIIKRYKHICLNNLKKYEAATFSKLNAYKKIKKVDRLKRFSIADCEKITNRHVLLLFASKLGYNIDDLSENNGKFFDKIRGKFIEYCKLGYAIKYRNNCNIINTVALRKKCFKLKQEIDNYRTMLNAYNIYYSGFDLHLYVR